MVEREVEEAKVEAVVTEPAEAAPAPATNPGSPFTSDAQEEPSRFSIALPNLPFHRFPSTSAWLEPQQNAAHEVEQNSWVNRKTGMKNFTIGRRLFVGKFEQDTLATSLRSL